MEPSTSTATPADPSSSHNAGGRVLRALVACAAIFAMALLIAACGGDDDDSSTDQESVGAGSTLGEFKPSAGTDIPKQDIKFAMTPYGDQAVDYIGMQNGYYDEVGLTLTPESGDVILDDQVIPRMKNDQIEIAPYAMSLAVQGVAAAPEVKMIQHNDIYVGNMLLISGETGDKTVKEFVDEGQSFDEAMKSTIQQLKGKKVALSDTGANREFFNLVMKMGGLTPKDVDLQVMADTAQVQLARSGELDYAFTNGAGQVSSMLNIGFKRGVGAIDLIEGLPPGDPRAATGISDSGVAAKEEWVKDNLEAVLRYISVRFRLIDEIQEAPDEPLGVLLPFLNSAADLDLSLDQLKAIFTDLYSMIDFERQKDWWVNKDSQFYVETVYKPHIEAAKAGGVIPAGTDVTVDDLTMAGDLWKILNDLKGKYDALEAEAGDLSGEQAELAEQAATFYEHRNYLDAYRFLKAATEG